MSPYPHANHLGIIRVAFEVDDIQAARTQLLLAGHGPVGPVETWDMGDYGERKVVIFKDPGRHHARADRGPCQFPLIVRPFD